mmetsp:Transcript_458/g.910  ORF Transcript_458/g.910 Transcript_458/m.910 type:complete len:227 (-) Transcript_458:308-988(-)
MRSISILSLLLSVVLSPLASAEVIHLTDATFEHTTQASTGQTTGKWFTMFHAPWCGHCKSLGPVWEELDQRIQESNPQSGILLAKVDATKETELANRFKIRSYPTLKYFADRKLFTYKGSRNIDALYEFVTEGYKTAKDEEIPSPPSLLDVKMKEFRNWFFEMTKGHDQLKYLLEDFEHILSYRKNAAVVLVGMGVVLGFFIGMIVAMLTMGDGTKEKANGKSKKE